MKEKATYILYFKERNKNEEKKEINININSFELISKAIDELRKKSVFIVLIDNEEAIVYKNDLEDTSKEKTLEKNIRKNFNVKGVIHPDKVLTC